MWWCVVDVKMKMEAMAWETKRSTLDSSIRVVSGVRSPPARQANKQMYLSTLQFKLELSDHVIVHCTMRTLLHCVSSVLQCSVTGSMASSVLMASVYIKPISEDQMPSTEHWCTLSRVDDLLHFISLRTLVIKAITHLLHIEVLSYRSKVAF